MEEWRDIKGYEERYQVSSMGRIKTKRRRKAPRSAGDPFTEPRTHNEYLNKSGYPMARLSINSTTKRYLLHRIVASHFISEIPIGLVVNHIDGNPRNNKVSNLEIVSQFDNNRHGRVSKKSTSKYIGVFYDKQTNKWRAQLSFGGNRYNLGRYKTEELAFEQIKKKMLEIGVETKYTESVL